jgi:hypothetical protein
MFLTNEARLIYDTDPAEGWARFAPGGIELYSAAGDNHSLFTTPQIEELAEKLKFCMAKAEAN